MALKINKNLTIQGGIDINPGVICQIDIKTNHIPKKQDDLPQLILLSFYRDQASYPLEKMINPKEIPFDRFNVSLTSDEFNNISGEMMNQKAKDYIVENTELEDSDIELINV